jgi:hypothetical protein
MADNALIRIITAFLKHQVKKHIGDEAFAEIGAEIVAIGGDELDNKLKTWIGEKTTAKELERVAVETQKIFRDKIGNYELEQWMISLPLGNLPSVTKAIDELPNLPDEKNLEVALRQSIELNWKNVSSEQANQVVNVFLQSIRTSLLTIENHREMIIGRSSLRTEEKVDRLTALFISKFGEPSNHPIKDTSLQSSAIIFEIPEGTMDPESNFYIERPEDKILANLLKGKGYTVTIKGPRQVGKSSLLYRAIKNEEDSEKRIAFLDFQLLDSYSLIDANVFYKRFCSWLSDEISIADKVNDYWTQDLGPAMCCSRYISKYILPNTPKGLVIAIDETEHIFGSPFRSGFFGMLRSWHNKRREGTLWKHLSLILVTSTEPNVFITELNQSPFNVGRPILISDFTIEHINQLNEKYGSPITPDQKETLFHLLSGQPYLTHLSINLIASGATTFHHLFESAYSENGVFINHLQKHLINLQAQQELVTAFKQIINTGTCPDEISFIRLFSAGLAIRKKDRLAPRCELYSRFFKERLNAG